MQETQIVFYDGAEYERFMGRWSRAIGEKFLAWLNAPKGARWLDVGCGTGAFTGQAARDAAPRSIVGVDPAPAQIEYARREAAAKGATFEVADATALPFPEGAFDVVASALVYNFIPDRPKALAEMRRVLAPGGMVAAYIWEREPVDRSPHAPMEQGMVRIGAGYLKPPVAPEGTPDGLKRALAHAGFRDVDVTLIEARQTYRDFDDYWASQTVSLAPIGKSVAALSDAQRAHLREVMHTILPADRTGGIGYASRALAFRATRPG
jgi:SAM-dependent methyltransferase